jgi:PAS domain S-box-containing protein
MKSGVSFSMRSLFRHLRTYSTNLGLVEQAQIVASTAVVVIMATIIAANIALNKIITWFDFISILTVGVIGFASVYFSLKYGRQLEEQKRELVALNTVSEAVTHSIDLNYLLSDVLQKIVDVARSQFGWIYVAEGKSLILKKSVGADFEFFNDSSVSDSDQIPWLEKLQSYKVGSLEHTKYTNPKVQGAAITCWVSVPLHAADQFAGVLILGSTVENFFNEKQIDLISAFGNHISVALNNAHLFDRLRKSEQQYADLFEHSPDMYHLVNREGIIISCNQTEAQTLGYYKSDIIGFHLSRLYPESGRSSMQQTLHRAFDLSAELRDEEEQMVRKDGSIIDVSVNTSLVYDTNNVPVLMRCVVRNITEKKKLEQKIIQAQKIDSIGNLAGGVAHDFNNILASILGSASIMRRRMKPAERWYPFVEIIETAAKRGSSLTRQLLTFARRSNVEVHPIDVHAILNETISLFERSVNPNISIAKNFTPDTVVINGDEGQIQQAMLNLFINARDAMPNGGTLTVTTSSTEFSGDGAVTESGESRNGAYAQIKITDTGTGMSREVQQRIFEPFFTTKDHGKGTGLGLSVVYGVINTHNGYISVQSEMEKGTTFSILLPKLSGSLSMLPRRKPKKIVGGKESILVVDDEEIVCTTIKAMLTDLGYKVLSARNGKEALEVLDNNKEIDMVILDMTMPDMGGKSVYQKMKRKKMEPKVLISSGYSDSVLGEKSFAKKVDGFLQKPYQIEDLAQKIREVLDRKDSNGNGTS